MKKIIRIALLLFVLAGIAWGTAYYFIYWPNTQVKDKGIIYIQEGDSFDTVLEILQSKGYIENMYTLRKVAGWKKYPERIKSGRYRLRDRMSNNALVNLLRSGNQEAVNFTFNNVRTFQQLAGIVDRQLEMDSVVFLEAVQNPEIAKEFGFTPENFRTMFLPNTYQIYWNISPADFISKMAVEYKRFWNSSRQEKAKKTGLSPVEVIILASIVEEETVKPEEYPVIAGVYINRIKKDIPLAACPTLKYAWGDFSLQRILTKHTEIDSPYNTYKYIGLPPGPVRMPSIQVIDAVLNYQKHDYLFFCAKSDFSGEHHFSRTLRQHNEYARQYHEALNRRRIYH